MKHLFLSKAGILALCLTVVLVGTIFFGEDTVPASALVESRRLPIYCVQTEAPKVSLSFDAAWGNEDTNDLLSILAKHNIKTTFFMTGGWVESYPEDVKAISDAGHDLGNHSENHKQMSQLSAEEQVAAGVYPNLLRLSVGTESIDDLIVDLGEALA